jgi:CspA family cold shock protein
MTIGTVKFFNDAKGYGFIAPDGGGQDAFVHISAVENSGMRGLRENQRVSYELEQDRRGKMAAVNLKDASEASAQEQGQAQDQAQDQAQGQADEQPAAANDLQAE